MSEAVKTTCPYCGVGCGLRVTLQNGPPLIEADPDHPANYGRICTKGASLGETVDLEGRLLQPQIRGRDTDWNTALDRVAEGFRRAIDQYGPDAVAFYVSGQLLTEDYYVANKLMKGFIGSGNIDTNSRLCMSSAVAGHQRALGEDLVTGCYEDLEQAEVVVIVGGNSAWCHPVLFQRIQAARERRGDMQIVVIDPRRTATADTADLFLPIKPGTDVAMFNGLFRHLRHQGLADQKFIETATEGYDKAVAVCEEYDIDRVATVCDVDRGALQRFYDLFARHERSMTLFSQGVNQASTGTDKVNAIINCHLLTNRIGKPGSGPFSLTGQPNAMGGREVGGLASTLAAHMDFENEDIERVQRFWSSGTIAARPGFKAVDLFREIEAGRVKAVWIMATNPVVSLPDAEAVRRALSTCEFVVVSDCMAQTDTSRFADILLPAAAWGEKDGTVTNSERRISRQRAFLPLPGEAKPDWWIISEIGRRLGYAKAFDYNSPAQIFAEHARLSAFENNGERQFNIGGLAGLTAAGYDRLQPVQWPVPAASRVLAGENEAEDSATPYRGTARLVSPGNYATPGRRARFIAVQARDPVNRTSALYPFVLNSGRVRDHWHTLTRTGKSPRLSVHRAEPFIAVHPDDAAALALQENRLAEVSSQRGKLIARVQLDTGQRPGELFVPIHWNDQYSLRARIGALVNPVVDPLSGEPEFKFTPARVRPIVMTWFGFLLMRANPQTGQMTGVDYWTRLRGHGYWHLEMAGREAHGNRAAWARRLLGAAHPDADWLEFADAHAGCYRVASLDAAGRLDACLMLAPTPEALPERSWLGSLFAKQALEGRDRMILLAGRAPGNEKSGTTVCSCHSVGRDTLIRAICEEGLNTTEALGQRLKAGTNCGACLPELRQLIENCRSRPPARATA